MSKRVDTKLHNVQSVLAKAAAGILVVTEKLHTLKTSASLAVAENTKTDPDSLLDQTNQLLAFNGDVIALLRNAQQELSSRRRFSLQSSFPNETASLCQARIPASNLLFGDDTDRLVKSAREQFRATQHRGSVHASHRYHPYRKGGAVPAAFFRSRLRPGPINITVPVPERDSQVEGCVPPPTRRGGAGRSRR